MVVLHIDHIVSEPDVSAGRPHINGSRVRVQDVAAFQEGGWDARKIADELSLPIAQIHAALAYYFDHQDEIDQARRDEAAAIKQIAIPTSALRQQMAARRTSHNEET